MSGGDWGGRGEGLKAGRQAGPRRREEGCGGEPGKLRGWGPRRHHRRKDTIVAELGGKTCLASITL